jgi:hypothetical protein
MNSGRVGWPIGRLTKRCNSERLRIRLCALLVASTIWVVPAAFLAPSVGASRAAIFALIGSFGGLFAWAVYHVISGRNDGLAIMLSLTVVAMNGSMQPSVHSMKTELARRAVMIVVMAIFSVPLAFFVRRYGKRQAKPSDSPVWDAELDQG